jgi:hypothetical protein
LADDALRAARLEIERWRASGFRDFAGARFDFRVPLREPLLNAVLERYVLPRVPALRSITLRVGEQNRLDVTVETAKVRWLPPISIPFDIEPDLRLTPDVTSRLHIVGSGVVATLSPLLRFITLPPGVRLVDSVVEIDITRLLQPADAATLVAWLRNGRITTTGGTLWLDLRLALDDDTVS